MFNAVSDAVPAVKFPMLIPYRMSASPEEEVRSNCNAAFVSVASPSSPWVNAIEAASIPVVAVAPVEDMANKSAVAAEVVERETFSPACKIKSVSPVNTAAEFARKIPLAVRVPDTAAWERVKVPEATAMVGAEPPPLNVQVKADPDPKVEDPISVVSKFRVKVSEEREVSIPLVPPLMATVSAWFTVEEPESAAVENKVPDMTVEGTAPDPLTITTEATVIPLSHPVPMFNAVSDAVPAVKFPMLIPYRMSASPEEEVRSNCNAAFVSVASPSSPWVNAMDAASIPVVAVAPVEDMANKSAVAAEVVERETFSPACSTKSVSPVNTAEEFALKIPFAVRVPETAAWEMVAVPESKDIVGAEPPPLNVQVKAEPEPNVVDPISVLSRFRVKASEERELSRPLVPPDMVMVSACMTVEDPESAAVENRVPETTVEGTAPDPFTITTPATVIPLSHPVPMFNAVSAAVPPVKFPMLIPYRVSASPEEEVRSNCNAAFVSVASPSSPWVNAILAASIPVVAVAPVEDMAKRSAV